MKKALVLTLALVVAFSLTACGSSPGTNDKNTATDKESTTEKEMPGEVGATENNEGYPIVCTHAFGETVIETEPQRIVTVGWGNLDVPLALGVAPVGVSKATYGATDANGLFSWTNEAFAALGVDSPNVFDDTDGLDFEAINNANPDLILAVYSGISEEEYHQLSEIAPTVAYQEAWAITWQDLTRENGRAIGKEDEAEVLVEEISALITEKTAEYPEIAGLTAAYCYFDSSNLGSFYVYMPKDPRAAYLVDLGLDLPENIRALDDGSFFFMTVSSENIDVLNDLDLIVTWGESDTLTVLQNDPLISQVPAISRGSVVFLSNDSTLIAASCTPTTLSIKATIDEYLSLISDAAKLR